MQFADHQLPAGFTRGRPIVAHSAISDNRADVSSAAAEVYAAGNVTMDILVLSYVCSEAGVAFPARFNLHIDNAAAQSFASQTSYSGKSQLRHVDARHLFAGAILGSTPAVAHRRRAVRSDGATMLEPGLSILRPICILRNFRQETFPKLLKIFRKGMPELHL